MSGAEEHTAPPEQRIVVRYDPSEDRLVVLLTRTDPGRRVAIALGLTRRLWKGLRANLQEMLDRAASPPESQGDSGLRKQSRTASRTLAGAALPIRNQAVSRSPDDPPVDLVIGVKCGQRKSDRRWVLTFRIKDKPDFSLQFNDLGLNTLASALFLREAATGWGLPPLPASAAAVQLTQEKKALH